jgi:hypothetical protein
MPEEAPRKRRGRPAKPEGERKRGNLTFRTRDVLRKWLADAAAQSGRSTSEEIEYRLERSFDPDWVSHLIRDNPNLLLNEIALIMIRELTRSGRSWKEDKGTRDAIRQNINSLFDALDQEGAIERLEDIRKTEGSRLNYAWRNLLSD